MSIYVLACLAAFSLSLPAAEPRESKAIYNSQVENIPLLKPEEALGRVKLPEGFRATLFAAEPEVHQPIGMTFDSRGRLWVAENYTYAESALNFDTNLNDRIVILADRDGDGRHDERKVFWDQAKKLTSVAVGFGGVYAMCPPHLLFIPDRNGDDVPDGPPEVLLDGWDDDKIRHTLANGLKWGPDGWLYGRQGIQGTSFVGRPGAGREERTAVNGSIWRFHPVRRTFELVAQGTTNPWGADWDENGELFFINTVIGHLWHAIPGAYFKRMYGQPFNLHIYEEIDQVADHVHWDTREAWNDINKGISSSTSDAGGGHAHTGLLMYLGGNWPDQYRNRMFTLNFHGKRINSDRVMRSGATYTARHEPDFMTIDDPYFRGIDLLSGPEGAVYVADWSDIGECHDHNGVHRTSGRIYRIAYGEPKKELNDDLALRSNLDLVKLLSHRNEWFVRQARLVLQERAVAGENVADAREALGRIVGTRGDAALKLRALWALHGVAGASEDLLLSLLGDANEHVRVWAIRLFVDEGAPSNLAVERLARMAQSDSSGLVLTYLASAMQRLKVEDRWDIAAALSQRGEFENDRVLPLMVWYGIEAAIPTSAERTADLIGNSKLGTVGALATRRVFGDLQGQSAAADRIIGLLPGMADARKAALLRAMLRGLQGGRNAVAPNAWATVAPELLRATDAATRSAAIELDATFGGTESLAALAPMVKDRSFPSAERRRWLEILARGRVEGLEPLLGSLLADPEMAANAVEAFAASGSLGGAETLIARYAEIDPRARREVINALISRPAWVAPLLESIRRGKIARNDITASHLRQLRGINAPEVQEKVALIWPGTRESERNLYAKYRKLLSDENLGNASLQRGREVYQLSCAPCHKLYGEGTTIGPELTGSDRKNLEYLLENILSPSGIVPEAYRVANVNMKDDRALSGIVVSANEQSVTLQTLTEQLTLPRSEIESIQHSDLSMMPEGLLENLSEQQVLDLVAYLRSSAPPELSSVRGE